MKITEKSDVYSYGVVVLEVLTGKQPIDPTIPDGLHVVDWVRRRKCDSSEVLYPSLRGRPDSEAEEMLQALGVALLCVNPTPDERPTMKDVAAMLKEIRHEREEYAKVDVLLKGSSPAVSATTSNSAAAALLCQQAQANGNSDRNGGRNNDSFSAVAIYSSSSSSASKAKSQLI